MHEIIEFLKMFDIGNLVAIGALGWFFNRSINSKFDEVRQEFKEMHKEMKEIREDMFKEFKFTNIRLSRVEGTVYGKDIYKGEGET